MSWGSEDEHRQNDEDRQALADLLVARGHTEAAVVVAASEFSTEWNDIDGDGLCVRLAVPPALYDRARTEFRNHIDHSCVDVMGDERYSGLRLAVRRSPLRPGLVEQIVEALAQRRWVKSERVEEVVTKAVDTTNETSTGTAI